MKKERGNAGPAFGGGRFRRIRRKKLRTYLRRLRLRRERKKRAVRLLVLFAIFLYLAAIGTYRDAFLSVSEREEFWTVSPDQKSGAGQFLDVFRISIRLKSGEIIFFHERTEQAEEGGDRDS